MIQWPCMFKLDGDAELMFFTDEPQLYIQLEELIWDSSDRLIDSTGQGYIVRSTEDGYVFEQQGTPLSLELITQFIQEHEFSKAQMCLTKIQFTSIHQAIESISRETQ